MTLTLALSLLLGSIGLTTTSVNATTATTKKKTVYYSCKLGTDCMYVRLAARFTPSKCTDVYWDGSSTHWPNAVTLGNTKQYTSSARGTYKIYSSLITQWISLAFKSETDTIYICK